MILQLSDVGIPADLLGLIFFYCDRSAVFCVLFLGYLMMNIWIQKLNIWDRWRRRYLCL